MSHHEHDRRQLLRWSGWFLVIQSLICTVLAFRYLTVGDLPTGLSGTAFGVAMYLGHFASLSALLYLTVVVLALLWPAPRLILGIGTGLAIIFTVLLLIDTFVFQQYRFHINALMLSLVFSGAVDDIFIFSMEMAAWATALVAALVLIQYGIARGLWRLVRNGRGRGAGYLVATTLTAVFVGQNLAYAYFDAKGNAAVMRAAQLLPLYDPLTAKGFLAEQGFDIETGNQHPGSTETGLMNYPRSPLDIAKESHRPNILFIVMESWRFDAIGPKITPNIHEFAQQAARFDQHFSGGNSSRTGLFSLLYGIPGTYWHSALSDGERPALIDMLVQKDYRFFVSASSDLTTPPYNRILFRDIDGLRFKPGDHSSVERDRVTANKAQANLRKNPDQPFFGFVFFAAPHSYTVPDNDRAPFQPSWDNVNYMALGPDFDRMPFYNRYRNAVHFADKQIGRVLDTLREQDRLQDTIVVITADHAQQFNDNGDNYWGHNGNFTRYQTQVPLVVHWPGRQQAQHGHLTSHMDVAPTILDRAFGADQAHERSGVGRDLFQPGGRLPLVLSKYSEYAARTRDRITVFKPWGAVQVRDLQYRLLEDAEPESQVLQTTLERISSFHHTDGSAAGGHAAEPTTAHNEGF